MKKIINERTNLISEMVEGIVAAYDDKVKKLENVNALVKKNIPDNKVILLVGGGSGHEPIYHGLIGHNMADAAAIGNICAAPNPEIIVEAAKNANRGKGILFLYGNYSGDNMNFDVAAELLEEEGIKTKTVRINDDAAIEKLSDRRGIAGLLFAVKIAGAACAKETSLDEAYRITKKAVDNTRSMGVAVRSGIMLNTGEATFDIGADEIEIGMGLHGEPGIKRIKIKKADEITEDMMKLLLADLPFKSGNEVAVLINDLGATTYMELYIVNRKVNQILKGMNISIYKTVTGKYSTSMDMEGFSISLIKLDKELKQYLDMNAVSLAYTHYNEEK